MGYLNNPGVAAFIGGIQTNAPFNIDEFRAFTGILVPPFGGPLHPDLSQKESELCRGYLQSAWALRNPETRIKFIHDDQSEGKKVFNRWYTKQWKDNETSAKFDRLMRKVGVDGAAIMSVGKKPSVTHAASVFPVIAQELFGPESVQVLHTGFEMLKDEWQPVIGALIFASFARAKKIIYRLEKKLVATLNALETEVEDMLNGQSLVTKAQFDKITSRLMQAEVTATVNKQTEEVEKCRDLHVKVQNLVELLQHRDRTGKQKATCQSIVSHSAFIRLTMGGSFLWKAFSTFTSEQLNILASAADIDAMWTMYDERFNFREDPEGEAELEARIVDLTTRSSAQRMTPNDLGSDLGVELVSQYSDDDLRTGFAVGSNWFGFNKVLHLDECNPTEHSNMFGIENDARLIPLVLHWHQIVGVAALVRCLLPAGAPEHTGYALLGDEFGMGKTLQVLAFITLIPHIRKLNGENKSLPPFLKSLGSSLPKATDGPTLIVAPAAKISHWRSEAFKALLPGSFDLFVYSGEKAERAEFWLDNGPWKSSFQPEGKRIILVSISDLVAEGELVLDLRRKRPNSYEAPYVSNDIDEECRSKNLFSLGYSLLVVDDAHHHLSGKGAYNSLLALRDASAAVIACTATPLHSAPQDISTLGRIIGHPGFMSSEAERLQNLQASAFERLRKKLGMQARLKIAERQRMRMRGEEPHISDPMLPLRQLQLEQVRELKERFGDFIIRRSVDSKMFDGKPCIQFPLHEVRSVWVMLTPEELKRVDEAAKAACTNLSGTHAGVLDGSRFFTDYRKGLAQSEAALGEELPLMRTQDDFIRKASTKVRMLVSIFTHALSTSKTKPEFYIDGTQHWPPLSNTPRSPSDPLPKLICHHIFPSLADFLEACLLVNGIKSIQLNDKTNAQQLSATIERFRTDPEINVLLLSSIGSARLNLTFVSGIAFLDQVWSGQDRNHVIRQVNRPGQHNVVEVWDILALETADAMMSSTSKSQEEILNTFLDNRGDEILHALLGTSDGEESEEEQPAQKMSTNPRKKLQAETKVTTKQSRPQLTIAESTRSSEPQMMTGPNDPEVQNPAAGCSSPRYAMGSKRRRSVLHQDYDRDEDQEEVLKRGSQRPTSLSSHHNVVQKNTPSVVSTPAVEGSRVQSRPQAGISSKKRRLG